MAAPPNEGTEPWKLVVLATKAADAVPAYERWRSAIRPGTPIVAMQNGLPDPRLQAACGDALVECVVAFPATLLGVGRSQQTGVGDFMIGVGSERGDRLRRGEGPDLHLVEDVLAVVAPTQVVGNLLGAKWTKLIINACITTLGVVTGRDLGVLLRDRRARRIFLDVLEEGHAVGRALGVRFAPVGGLEPGAVTSLSRLGPGGRALQHVVLRLIGRKARRQRSSSLQGLRRGRGTEVDRLNGAIVTAAHDVGLEVPVNEALVRLVARIEAGELAPDPELLDGLPRTSVGALEVPLAPGPPAA